MILSLCFIQHDFQNFCYNFKTLWIENAAFEENISGSIIWSICSKICLIFIYEFLTSDLLGKIQEFSFLNTLYNWKLINKMPSRK